MTVEKTFTFNGVEYKIVKKFFSRLNSVFLIESINEKKEVLVLKDFEDDPDSIHAELNGMRIFKDISPELYFYNERYLVHEFIPGRTFLSVYEEAERTLSDADIIINSMTGFLKKAYENSSGYILGDINFNNFIIPESGPENNETLPIIFVDYENVKLGEIEEDIGRMTAFALTYDPVFTDWKYKFAQNFVNRSITILNASEQNIHSHIKKEFEAIIARRNLPVNISEVFKRFKIK